ncbi:MAG: low molecular weight phosphotyrosine protein phosphatase [Flavobacteriales bacterium]|nr:low molecular weight phosphotyrosine protein phosphatase [Flavobacteriales bacterium]
MKILLVCLGNICRSPMAEGILRDMIRKQGLPWSTDSAGTGDYHVGEAPDNRAQRATKDHGIDISDLRARQFRASDFEEFDVLLAMDESNLKNMIRLAPNANLASKAQLILDHAPEVGTREVPDPWFGEERGFDEVYDMLDRACSKVITHVRG